ncbi:hypothetical protein QBC43DRAFT_115354 [Cladorrhinum sp. PSN259]|nr:hypothetical protein QBC43DRAFT_115354 [Cladorrhinum sp. PSN259]
MHCNWFPFFLFFFSLVVTHIPPTPLQHAHARSITSGILAMAPMRRILSVLFLKKKKRRGPNVSMLWVRY